MVRLVFELGMQLQMRKCDCNGSAVCTFYAAVMVVCLGRYAIAAKCFLVLTPCVLYDYVFGLL